MANIKHIIKTILLAACIAAFFPINSARGTIASLTLTPANPTTLSNGLSYYLAGATYNFAVQVIDPDLTGWGQVGEVVITIPNSTAIVLRITPSGTGSGLPVTISSGTVTADADVSGTYNNYIVTFNVTIRWDTQELLTPVSNNISCSATTSYPAANTSTDTAAVTYGVCSSIKIINLAATGVASDGMVNQYHDSFDISGILVYNVSGATAADYINTVLGAAEIAGVGSVVLYINGVSTGIATSALPNLNFTVPAAFINLTASANKLGTNTFRPRVVMATAGGPESSFNAFVVNTDEVEITTMAFVNGGGINLPAYYRSVSLPGTEIIVTARMRNSLSAMVGNTTLTINNYTDGTTFQVVIPNGSTTGTALVPFPVTPVIPGPGGLPGANDYCVNFYRVEAVTGGGYGGDTAPNGQNVFTEITQPGAISIYWENEYFPWAVNTPFTVWGGVSATAYSLTFSWTGPVLNHPNYDFSSYRIYYKEVTAGVYQIIDKTTTGYANLGTSTTSTATITGLIPLTLYDYYITAIDVFGNEVPIAQALPAGAVAQIGTLASTITVTLSDGITTYENNTFTSDPLPSARPLRRTAIKVKVFIVAAGDLPDIVNLILADTDLGSDLITPAGIIDPLLTLDGTNPADSYYRITTLKTGANEWTGFIPDTNPFMTVGNQIKFIIETIKSGIATYADNDSETETPATADPNNNMFNFTVTYQPVFKPWPTRVLNNVINEKNPRAYPAYYLTDDAYVTITIYDIKGRVVKTLLDKAYRRGGQNIKEDGWQGDNKSNKKVGVGLYYIHFKGERTTDGKVILDSFQKVVMAR